MGVLRLMGFARSWPFDYDDYFCSTSFYIKLLVNVCYIEIYIILSDFWKKTLILLKDIFLRVLQNDRR